MLATAQSLSCFQVIAEVLGWLKSKPAPFEEKGCGTPLFAHNPRLRTSLSVKGSHKSGVARNVPVHGFQQIGARGSRREIKLLVERKEFERVVVRDWDVLRRTWGPVTEISALPGEAIGLMAAVRQIRACRRNALGKLVGARGHIPHHPVQDVIDALSWSRFHVM